MPKITLTERQKDRERLAHNLQLLQCSREYTYEDMGKIIGKSEGAWRYKMKEPWALFSYDELRALAKFCKVDFAQLLTGNLRIS